MQNINLSYIILGAPRSKIRLQASSPQGFGPFDLGIKKPAAKLFDIALEMRK